MSQAKTLGGLQKLRQQAAQEARDPATKPKNGPSASDILAAHDRTTQRLMTSQKNAPATTSSTGALASVAAVPASAPRTETSPISAQAARSTAASSAISSSVVSPSRAAQDSTARPRATSPDCRRLPDPDPGASPSRIPTRNEACRTSPPLQPTAILRRPSPNPPSRLMEARTAAHVPAQADAQETPIINSNVESPSEPATERPAALREPLVIPLVTEHLSISLRIRQVPEAIEAVFYSPTNPRSLTQGEANPPPAPNASAPTSRTQGAWGHRPKISSTGSACSPPGTTYEAFLQDIAQANSLSTNFVRAQFYHPRWEFNPRNKKWGFFLSTPKSTAHRAQVWIDSLMQQAHQPENRPLSTAAWIVEETFPGPLPQDRTARFTLLLTNSLTELAPTVHTSTENAPSANSYSRSYRRPLPRKSKLPARITTFRVRWKPSPRLQLFTLTWCSI
jgi:hypothetical protein